jgi:deoxyribodipyrimidine photo-lyase
LPSALAAPTSFASGGLCPRDQTTGPVSVAPSVAHFAWKDKMIETALQPPVELVWFKRDLRVQDHAALTRAARRGRVLCLYVYEPELMAHDTTDAAHIDFINASLLELDAALRRLGGQLITRVGRLPEVFDRLHAEQPFDRIWSHQETGLGITFDRDRRVKRWARSRSIELIEVPNHGVFRPHPSRDGWSARWRRRMAEPIQPVPERIQTVEQLASDGMLSPARLGVAGAPRAQAMPGGINAAGKLLEDFLARRSRGYQGDISSPVTAWTSSSRLSPHLAWGNLSMRQVYQAARARADALRASGSREERDWARSIDAFVKRLHWHCHFIQKLEDQPDIEFRNLSRAADRLRNERPDDALLDAWRHGQTGYPLVDACMRALHAGGWINFRMRAMLMSFASYHLWQHWRAPSLNLARLFLDFEPGIHFSQAQMQSGTTGINAVRIYSPVKQVRDQDPEGVFIRQWCPELEAVPNEYLPRPETMPLAVQQAAGCRIGRDYPRPIVDNGRAYMSARRRMQALRASTESRSESERIYQRHGSRRGRGEVGGASVEG